MTSNLAAGGGLQICYVVVGSGWDRHAQMAWLSAQSVRIQQPDARIVIVVEGHTPADNDELRTRFAGVADVLVKTSDWPNPVLKSRFHRIAIREYLTGDLLYLDSDTLAVAPFADILRHDGDVGAVIDFNGSPDNAWCPSELEAHFRQLGWTYPIRHYMNAGVVMMRDTSGVHAFCREWMARWLVPAAEQNTWDQPTFNSALVDSRIPYAVLPNGYNAMVIKRNYRFRESRILHFFGSSEEQRGTLMEHLLVHLRSHGTFDRQAYGQSIAQGHPWGPNPEAWRLWHSRNYVRAVMQKAKGWL
jgi:hypothetical protein